MKILYYDCFAGISGDMNLAAMVGLGVEPAFLAAELTKLGLDDEFELQVGSDMRNGISGTRVDVLLKHHHHHTDGDHHHGHHRHRNLADIEAIINNSTLDERIKETSLAIFNRVARAEAKVHDKPLDEVHFHEVGATDSIVDIVGAAICIHALEIDGVWSSPIELGGGFVQCAHGLIPVPAPATMEILTGLPTTRGAGEHESTTPTGAAILAELVDQFIATVEMTVTDTAYGIGHRQTTLPNVLRVHIAEVDTIAPQGKLPTSKARLLQCNIDDMTGEMLGVTMEILMEAGAMDVHFTPIIMKKSRPATSLSLLCSEEDEENFKRLIFENTTTLGIKSYPLDKTALEIRFEQVDTPWGTVQMKKGILDGQVINTKPELEDCKRIASDNNLTLAEVYAQIGKSVK
ncbi:nickel pincer cofactor biosynthesis protein LarC [Desulfosediminicola ganghwensis]|uniref:nickel pincer cofactor biosynthesis protein LarC n=1 Tax=Desulfosediminicola ganghwensis TaxID=2569540 RepID=UPI0010ACC66F|nr:nickel pincer cofactor biosynthesis protein LarC [Desulfosediminicola ganghwensis]